MDQKRNERATGVAVIGEGACPLSALHIRCALTGMDRLRRYLDNGILELDNNAAERGMRAIALGRKNYLFAGSEAGSKAAAIAYTLIETAKLNAVNPTHGSPIPSPVSRTTRSPWSMNCCPGAGTHDRVAKFRSSAKHTRRITVQGRSSLNCDCASAYPART
jgi:hypothetical protein